MLLEVSRAAVVPLDRWDVTITRCLKPSRRLMRRSKSVSGSNRQAVPSSAPGDTSSKPLINYLGIGIDAKVCVCGGWVGGMGWGGGRMCVKPLINYLGIGIDAKVGRRVVTPACCVTVCVTVYVTVCDCVCDCVTLCV